MTYLDPASLTPRQHQDLIDWLQGEDLNPGDVAADGTLTVHQGVVSGHLFIKTVDGSFTWRRRAPVKVHFSQTQVNPLPDSLRVAP